MIDYRVWQMNPKNDLSVEVQNALQNYVNKMGQPPRILEVSYELQDELPEGLQIVVSRTRIPKNIMYVGGLDDEEDSSLGMEVVGE